MPLRSREKECLAKAAEADQIAASVHEAKVREAWTKIAMCYRQLATLASATTESHFRLYS